MTLGVENVKKKKKHTFSKKNNPLISLRDKTLNSSLEIKSKVFVTLTAR